MKKVLVALMLVLGVLFFLGLTYGVATSSDYQEQYPVKQNWYDLPQSWIITTAHAAPPTPNPSSVWVLYDTIRYNGSIENENSWRPKLEYLRNYEHMVVVSSDGETKFPLWYKIYLPTALGR